MELEKVIQEKVNNLVSSGAVDKMIEAHLAKSIDGALNDLFREYSDFGKQIKSAIGNKLEINLNSLNIECYTAMVCRTIEDIMKTTALETSISKVQNHIKETLKLIEKKHWLLSEVVLKYREGLYTEGVMVDIEYKEEPYGNYIYLGERANNKYGSGKTHDITLHLGKSDNNRVFAVTEKGNHITPLTTGDPHKWQVFLMQLWANECTIEIDMDRATAVADGEEDF